VKKWELVASEACLVQEWTVIASDCLKVYEQLAEQAWSKQVVQREKGR
jgi:hypothetical protein